MTPTPALHDVIEKLQRHARRLRDHGVVHISVFGSTAVGRETPTSDVDLLLELTPELDADFMAYAGVAADLEEIVGRRVDVARLSRLRPHVRESAIAHAVRAF